MVPAHSTVTRLVARPPATEPASGPGTPSSPPPAGDTEAMLTGGLEPTLQATLPGSPPLATAPYVLLAEDDVKLAGLVTRALGHTGLATLVALTGDAALAAMRQDTRMVAVVLDVMIPHHDGIEVCRQIHRDGWQGPTIVISALDSPDIRQRTRQAGADVFLPKPFQLSELLDAVTGSIDGGVRAPDLQTP